MMTKKILSVFSLTAILVVTFSRLSAVAPVDNISHKKPSSLDLYNPIYHLPPVNQDTTNACWSFATLSFVESEMHRLNGKSIKLAVMFPVYHAFLEKSKYFIKTKGKSRFSPGDLFPTVLEIIQTYGIIPDEAYHGQVAFSGIYNHKALESEIELLKDEIIVQDTWEQEVILDRVRKILDKYLGRPPDEFEYEGEQYTPLSFARKHVHLPWDDYVMVTSFSYAPFYEFVKLDVPDNWMGLTSYYNVPLEVFYSEMKGALSKGYSLAMDGDIKEPGRIGSQDVCYIPAYDIPGAYIDQEARDYRFNKKITTDDHLMHIVGYANFKGEDWFLVKDSWRDAWEGKFKGYFMYHADYSRLKILAYLVHKDAIPVISSNLTK